MLAAAQSSEQARPLLPDGDSGFAGVAMRQDAGGIAPGFLAAARNLRCRKGVAATRKGLYKPAWANRTQPAVGITVMPFEDPYGAGVFKDPDGLEWVLTAAGGFVYRAHENNPATSIALPAGVGIFGLCHFVQAFNKIYLFRGRDLAPLRLTSFDTGFEDVVALWDASHAYAPVIGSAAAEEMAYGPFLSVTTLTSVGSTATVVTSQPHGYITGADITIKGANQAEYNGRFNVTVVDITTFTYQFAGSATTPATGTIKCSNMAYFWKSLGTLLSGVTATHVTVTATATKVAHGFTTGQSVTVAGATPAAYNGTFTITVTTADAFTYVMLSDPAANATGTITVRNHAVTVAGQNPDTNPEAWSQLFNILPNAETALYVAGRLAVPTAYNPDTGLYDAKVDYIITTDILDETHFDFVNQFRINQGSDDSIVDLCEFAESGASSDSGTVIVFKDKSVHILNGITYLTGAVSDLAGVTRRTVIPDYGICGPRAWCVVGKDVYFVASSRGVVSMTQSVNNKVQGVDLPLSDPIQPLMDRILWRLGSGIRMAWWDSKLYVAVPLENGTVTGANLIPAGAVYDSFPHPSVNSYKITGLVVGQRYRYTNDITFGAGMTNGSAGYAEDTEFTSTADTALLECFAPGATVGAALRPLYAEVNNAILVYDFLNAAWQGSDESSSTMPLEFFQAFVRGKERLFFLGSDGYVNQMEETDYGDQAQSNATSGLAPEELETYILTRGYTQGNRMAQSYGAFSPSSLQFKRGRKLAVVMGTSNPSYSIAVRYAGVSATQTICTDRTKDRTAYYQPWDAPAYDATNVNDDHGTAYRQDYSVPLPVFMGSGIVHGMLQETRESFKLTGHPARYAQVELTNTQGRIELRGIEAEAQVTERRKGVLN